MIAHEKNNFDFLRILFASLVIITHSYALTGLPEIDILSAFTNGHSSLSYVGVRGFFSISGFLIYTSFERTSSPLGFLWKRFIRIWPGLFILLILSALIVGPFISSLPVKSYFNINSTYGYITQNLLLFNGISYSLPGVFTNNLYPIAVNGSLWTLPYEVLFYLILCLFYIKKTLNINYVLIPLWIILFSLSVSNYKVEGSILSVSFDKPLMIELGLYFIAGILLSKNFFLLQKPAVKIAVFTVCVLAFILFSKHTALTWLQLLIIPLTTLTFAYLPIPFIHKAGTFGDFSYGIYIYGFWVQQLLVYLSDNTISLYNLMWMAWTVTLLLGILSWHLVEKRALKHKSLLK